MHAIPQTRPQNRVTGTARVVAEIGSSSHRFPHFSISPTIFPQANHFPFSRVTSKLGVQKTGKLVIWLSNRN